MNKPFSNYHVWFWGDGCWYKCLVKEFFVHKNNYGWKKKLRNKCIFKIIFVIKFFRII